jgi:hypothetical protein
MQATTAHTCSNVSDGGGGTCAGPILSTLCICVCVCVWTLSSHGKKEEEGWATHGATDSSFDMLCLFTRVTLAVPHEWYGLYV